MLRVFLMSLALLTGSAQAERLVIDKKGVQLQADDGRVLDRLPLRLKHWDQRRSAEGRPLALVHEGEAGQLRWLEAGADGRLRTVTRWSTPAEVAIDSLCLYRDAQGLLQLFLLGSDGRSEQWLLDGPAPHLLRRLATPPEAKACAVRDAEAQLYVVEEKLGIWAIAADAEREGRRLLLRDDAADEDLLPRWLATQPEQALPAALPIVLPTAQTDPVSRKGDAADDPAIWLHPRTPARSRILGTDKQRGLAVYDLQGRQTQFLPVGRVNNVDLRQGLRYAGARWDLAVASQRDEAALVVFAVNAQGRVRELTRVKTALDDIYGVCAARNTAGRFEMIVNDKDGRFEQHELLQDAGAWRGQLRRSWKLASQPEACVADEAGGWLFIGEEKRGIWRLPLDAAQAPALSLVHEVGGLLTPDVEGLAIWQRGSERYLVASSQGNDSYAVFDAAPPHAPRGAFRIGLNLARGVDGASETDGLEISSANLGGPYAEGLLVVQDGRKNLPDGPQNFKLVPWRAVREALQLSR